MSTENKPLNLKIGPRFRLPDAKRLWDTSHIISIFEHAELGTDAEPTPEDIDKDKHHRLYFDDIYVIRKPEDEHSAPQPDHAAHIISLYDLIPKDEPVYVHCYAGVSRSTATAFILQCMHLGPGRELEAIETVEKQAIAGAGMHPNERLIRFADQLLGRDGAMIDAFVTWKNRPKKWLENIFFME